jgi:hypothetical protein
MAKLLIEWRGRSSQRMKSTALALLLFASVFPPAYAQTNPKAQNPNPQPIKITIEARVGQKNVATEIE